MFEGILTPLYILSQQYYISKVSNTVIENKLWNMFMCNKKDTRTTPIASFWCLYCYLWTYFTPWSTVSIVNFEQVNASWINSLNATRQIYKSNSIPKCHISACFLNMLSNCQTECLLAGSYLEVRWPSCMD